MTEIYIHIFARMADYIHTHPYEPLSTEFYGWVLLLSVIGLLAAAVALTARRIRHGEGRLTDEAPLLDVGARAQASIGGSE